MPNEISSSPADSYGRKITGKGSARAAGEDPETVSYPPSDAKQYPARQGSKASPASESSITDERSMPSKFKSKR